MQTKQIPAVGAEREAGDSCIRSSASRVQGPLKPGRLTAMCAGAVLAMLAAQAHAHHSFAMYDRTQTVQLTGKLTRFIPGANHAQILFELIDEHGDTMRDENGQPIVWGFETQPSARIARDGVTVASFPPGTLLSVTVHPLRDGRTFGVLAGPIVKCGASLPERGCTEETGEVFIIGGN